MKRCLPVFLVVCFLLLGTTCLSLAQTPPGTDIWLVSMQDDASVHPDSLPINLTDRDGYDNQPFFTPDGTRLLYTSAREEGQTDIFAIDLATRRTLQVTNTSESEYSANVVPAADGFTVIRVEADGTQRLWQFDMDGRNAALVFEEVKPVGYQAWVDDHQVALFVLGSPPTLQLADRRTGKADTLAHRIGRSLHRIPGTQMISFVHKEADDRWVIKKLDPTTRTISPLVETLPGREDYAWLPNGTLLMGDGAILYAWHPDRGAWHAFYDLSDHGVTNITRIATHPGGTAVAIVADRP